MLCISFAVTHAQKIEFNPTVTNFLHPAYIHENNFYIDKTLTLG